METQVALALIGGFGAILSTMLTRVLSEMHAMREDLTCIKLILAAKADQDTVTQIKERVNKLEYFGNAKR